MTIKFSIKDTSMDISKIKITFDTPNLNMNNVYIGDLFSVVDKNNISVGIFTVTGVSPMGIAAENRRKENRDDHR